MMERRGSQHVNGSLTPSTPTHGRSKSLGGVGFGPGGVPMSPVGSLGMLGSPLVGGGAESEWADIQAR